MLQINHQKSDNSSEESIHKIFKPVDNGEEIEKSIKKELSNNANIVVVQENNSIIISY